VLAELRDEQLVVRVQLRSGVYETTVRPPDTSLPLGAADQRRFNDDRWHKLVVTREAREVMTLSFALSVRLSVRRAMCGSMVDIQSAVAEMRRGIKKKIERNHRAKI